MIVCAPETCVWAVIVCAPERGACDCPCSWDVCLHSARCTVFTALWIGLICSFSGCTWEQNDGALCPQSKNPVGHSPRIPAQAVAGMLTFCPLSHWHGSLQKIKVIRVNLGHGLCPSFISINNFIFGPKVISNKRITGSPLWPLFGDTDMQAFSTAESQLPLSFVWELSLNLPDWSWTCYAPATYLDH